MATDRSFSPSNRFLKSNENRSFRKPEEYDEDFEDRLTDSECEENILETNESVIFSPSMFQSPDKSFNNRASPHGSPRLLRRGNFEDKGNESIHEEKVTEEYTHVYDGNDSVSVCSENSPRRPSLTRVEVKKSSETINKSFKSVQAQNYMPTPTHEHSNKHHSIIQETVENSSLPCSIIILGSLVIVIIAFLAGYFFLPNNVKDDSAETIFVADWMKLKVGFKNQADRFWSITGAATKSVIYQKKPRDPAVILLTIPKSSTLTGRCFLRKYIATVTKFFGNKEADVIQFNSQVYQDLKPDRVKMKIDRELEDGFKSGRKVAVVEHLESLKAEAAMMFHKFCDNDIAPFKRVVIIFTLHLSDEEFSNSNESDRFVEEKLAELWEPVMGVDNFRPLMSRIANNVVFLRPESSDNLIGC